MTFLHLLNQTCAHDNNDVTSPVLGCFVYEPRADLIKCSSMPVWMAFLCSQSFFIFKNAADRHIFHLVLYK